MGIQINSLYHHSGIFYCRRKDEIGKPDDNRYELNNFVSNTG